MAPRHPDDEPAGVMGDVPLDPDWPDIDAAEHKFRVDHNMLRQVGNKLIAQAEEYHDGPGGVSAVERTGSLGAAWGGWEAAAPLQASAEQAIRHAADVYQRLLREYETAGRLLLETARNYADADITTHLAAIFDGKTSPSAGW
jgi:hypothetical protein